MNKLVLIVGYGQMGQAIQHGMRRLGFSTLTVDEKPGDSRKINPSSEYLYNFKVDYHSVANLAFKRLPSLIISSLPYYCNYYVAKAAVESKIPYCDLGGDPDTSKKIAALGGKTFTDLGLAPGWINIEAANLVKNSSNIKTVSMLCGGLPQRKEVNPAGYIQTWSIDGLINEYLNKCDVLENGVPKKVDGFTDVQNMFDDYEAFHTSGGMGNLVEYLQKLGIQNATYKTLRYKGHHRLVSWLLESKVSKEELQSLFKSGPTDNDKVYWEIDLECEDGMHLFQQKEIKSNIMFTAMQRATAFPLCAVASQMTREYPPQYYWEVDYDEFKENLNKLL